MKKTSNENKLYYSLLGFVILLVVKNKVWDNLILNSPRFLLILTIVLTVLLLFTTRRLLFLYQISVAKSKHGRIALVSFNLFKFFIVFFAISNIFVTVTFDVADIYYSQKNGVKEFQLEVLHVSKGTSITWASVQFMFNGRINIYSGDNYIYKILQKNRANSNTKSYIYIKCRKGLFNSYVAEESRIIY
jgi:hypothetical protein